MALDLITGHQGVAHISAEQISDINKAMMNGYGDNKVMRMSGGAITQNSLTLEIATGYWRANGFDIQIQESETHYIDPSTIGTSRIDNIYVELLQDIPTGAQRAEITIIMGEESASPVAPEDPTEPYLNTDILLDAVQIGTVTVTEGAMVFTDLTEEYDLVTPSDLAAVQTLATNALGMIQDDSDAYSSSKAYAVGDLCIHDDIVYKCITACSAAAWSVNQNCFEPTTLTDEISTLKDALTEFAKVQIIETGSLHDIIIPGIYYCTSAVADLPSNSGGVYILGSYNEDTITGLFINTYDRLVYHVRKSSNTWNTDLISIPDSVLITGTTTSSGALGIPAIYASKVVISTLIQNDVGFAFRRDNGYFTVFNNDMTPKANKYVELKVLFI